MRGVMRGLLLVGCGAVLCLPHIGNGVFAHSSSGDLRVRGPSRRLYAWWWFAGAVLWYLQCRFAPAHVGVGVEKK